MYMNSFRQALNETNDISQGMPKVHVTHWVLKPTLNQHSTIKTIY